MTADLSQLGILLFSASLVAIVTRRLHLPYTVGLVLAGIGLHFLPLRLSLHLSKDLIFSVFLPPLVFEAALCIQWSEFKKDLPLVGLLASAGVVLAAAVTAAGMHYLLDWEWQAAILFGVLCFWAIAQHDTIMAVIAIILCMVNVFFAYRWLQMSRLAKSQPAGARNKR